MNTINCVGCGKELKLQVCQSAAGYYAGHWCKTCGPHDRQSFYFGTKEDAQEMVDQMVSATNN